MDAILDFSRESAWAEFQASSVFTFDLSAEDAAAYDAFVARARSTHYSQTRSWAKVASAGKPVTPYYFLLRQKSRVTAAAVVLRGRLGALPLPFAQVERGPVCDRKEDLPEALEALRVCTLQHGILRLSVMPYWSEKADLIDGWLDREGFSDCQSFSGRHARSLRLDLAKLEASDPFSAPHLAKVRQAIRRAERAGATARQAGRADIFAFRQMHEELLRLGNKSLPAEGWYDALAEYFFAPNNRGAAFASEFEGEPVSVIFITNHGGLATYVMGASSGRPLKFPKMMLPMSHAIIWAQKAGATTFDLGGIPLEGDPDRKRASIAEFKYVFSHTEISLVHEHVRWF